jgi:predicted PurR-regulated permease PerM
MESTLDPDAGPGATAPAAAPFSTAPVSERPSPIAVGIAMLVVLAVVAALYLARAFFVPLLIGILAGYALRPCVDWLKALRIPRAAGAALVLAAIVGGMAWAALSLGDDAAAMIGSCRRRRARCASTWSRPGRWPPRRCRRSTRRRPSWRRGGRRVAAGQGRRAPARASPIRKPSRASGCATTCWRSRHALHGRGAGPDRPPARLFPARLGEHFRRKLVQLVGPSLTRKKDAVRILEEIDTQVQRYLLVTLGSNVLVALATWIAFAAMGVEHAGVWGVAAGLLHFIPYLGPLVFAIASGLAGFMQFGTAVGAFAVAGVSMLVGVRGGIPDHDVAAEPRLAHERRGAVHRPAVLRLALGRLGLLLGAPLVAIAKVVCDRVDSLKPVGELLGH